MLFEAIMPDGKTSIRFHAADKPSFLADLAGGYQPVGYVFAAASDDTGGVVEPFGPVSLMAGLLEAHGAELLTWLSTHPIPVQATAPAVAPVSEEYL